MVESQCPNVLKNDLIEKLSEGTTIIFGGSGSLGSAIINRWLNPTCKIINVSRGEEKQWLLKDSINKSYLANFEQVIGDISNEQDVKDVLFRYKPTTILVAACLKHVDICEKHPSKAVQNNYIGLLNIQHVIMGMDQKPKTVLFISTDKACNPITTYGYSKALGESLILNSPKKDTVYLGIRYGNVLNSSCSIIPLLTKVNQQGGELNLTDISMTRFIMTIEQSINLIEYAILYGSHSEIIVPYLYSMKISELFELFSNGKPITITGLRCKEKIHEDLISDSESGYCYESVNKKYIHITDQKQIEHKVNKFDSSINNLPILELASFLTDQGYLPKKL